MYLPKLWKLLCIAVLAVLSFSTAWAQSNQTVNNGDATAPINFPGNGCTYNWLNDKMSIGLASSGIGDIQSFIAHNITNSPVVATITGTPVPARYAYIANYFDGTVTVINTLTNSVVGQPIKVGTEPISTTVSPDGNRVYVANVYDGTISVINTQNNTNIATIGIVNPEGMIVSKDSKTLYVANMGGSITVINTQTNIITGNINVIDEQYCLAISPDGSSLYATCPQADKVIVINTATNTLSGSFSAGKYPLGLVFSPDGTKVYVANQASNSVSVIATADKSLLATINIAGFSPANLCMTHSGDVIYATDGTTGRVYNISAINNVATTITYVPGCASGLSITPDGYTLYVENGNAGVGANNNSNTVSVISTSNSIVNTNISVGSHPIAFGNFITPATDCNSLPVKFTITVKPSLTPPLITTSAATGNIASCQGEASVSPYVKTVTVSGSQLQDNIKATASPNFEVSLNATGGYAASVTIAPSNGIVNNVPLYIRSAATAPSGYLAGAVQLSSTGASNVTVPVYADITATVAVAGVASQVTTNGSATNPVNFTGTANSYSWTNDSPSIMLPASGTGDIASFVASNTTDKPITATITVTPKNNQYMYITSPQDGTVIVSDINANAIAARIQVGSTPEGLTLSPDGSKVYVADYNAGKVWVINAATNGIITTVDVGNNCYGLKVTPDGKYVYVANYGSGTVSVIDAATNGLLKNITVDKGPEDVVISPDGTKAYVTNFLSGSVSVIDIAANQVTATLNCGVNPFGIAVSADGNFVYVTQQSSSAVSVINVAANSIAATIPVGTLPMAIIMNADGSRAYVSNSGSNTVSVINTSTNTVIATPNGGQHPVGLGLSNDGSILYVQDYGQGMVSQVNTQTNQLYGGISFGKGADSFGDFITPGMNCPGKPITFTITVNPSAVPSINADAITGNIEACEGNVSVSPNIGVFHVSGTNLKDKIYVDAPPYMEVSLDPANGYSGSVAITQTGGNITNVTVYVRLAGNAADAGPGRLMGNVLLTSPGAADVDVPVIAYVDAPPTVTATPATQTVYGGGQTQAINFTGTAAAYSWVNDTPAILFAASGTGNIPSFTASNNGNAPVTATLTVTPLANSAVSCPGTPVKVTITVIPAALQPAITAGTPTGHIEACVGMASADPYIGQITISGKNLSDDVTVTLPADLEVSLNPTVGYGNSLVLLRSGEAINNATVYIRSAASASAGSRTENITFSSNGAVSKVVPVNVQVDAPASVDKVANQSVVNGNLTQLISFTGSGSTFNWTNDNISIGLPASGSGDIAPFTALNTSSVPVKANIKVTPKSADNAFQCGNVPIVFTITVNPSPNNITAQDIVIPNTFTPNGDGVNDTWEIKSLQNNPNCTVAVYNRWGEKLYSSVGYAIPWDGTYKGKILTTGTYYYIINLKNGVNPISGWVAIIK